MYQINEVFLSVQGEGPSIGHPAVFIRFSGCNLACYFCDTKHEDYRNVYLGGLIDEVRAAAMRLPAVRGLNRRVVLTGGEPTVQMDLPLVNGLINEGFAVCVETNGLIGDPNVLLRCAEVVVSPKRPASELAALPYATAIKVLVPELVGVVAQELPPLADRMLDQTRLWSQGLFLQPITCTGAGRPRFYDNCRQAISLAEDLRIQHGQAWRVVPQTHVFMQIR